MRVGNDQSLSARAPIIIFLIVRRVSSILLHLFPDLACQSLAIERLFDQRLLLVLILVEVDEKGRREDSCHRKDDQDAQSDESPQRYTFR